MEKVARIKISRRQAAEGGALALVAAPGAFLFALMSAKEPDEDLVIALDLIGSVAGTLCLVSQIYMMIKERKRRRTQSQLEKLGTVYGEEFVEGCS